ncbi:hypothetical protein BO78DRAFT_282926, partial [Aspergillus sclerotiicarbonarius CBS 121057]
ASNITILGPGDLHQEVADTFLACVNATGIDYRLYVDSGMTILLPPSNRTIDGDGVDAPLLECMMRTSDTMNVAAEDTTEFDEKQASSVRVALVTYDWLVEQEAQGLRAVGTKPVSSEAIAARD